MLSDVTPPPTLQVYELLSDNYVEDDDNMFRQGGWKEGSNRREGRDTL